MKAWGLIATIVILGVAPFARAADASTSRPAVWASHSLIVDLRNLPKRYSCDELWYKFKSVLSALGARPDASILPYRCEHGVGGAGYSPKIQLRFSTPRVVSGRNVQWADFRVQSRSIRLEPGSPQHIDTADCKLLNQIRKTLLPYLGATVTEFNLPCQAVQAPDAPFGLTVQALIPVSQPQPEVASTSPAARPGRLP